jgi:hypothetical protein
MEGNTVDCKNVRGLVTALNINHNPEGWRPFTDSSKLNVKAAVLHNGKALPSFLANEQLDAQFFSLICLFQFSTCFEQPRAHHQENQLYQYSVWYVTV